MSFLDGDGFNVADWKKEAEEQKYDQALKSGGKSDFIPTGIYKGEIFYLEDRQTKKGGDQIRVGFEVKEGAFKGKSVFSNLNVVCPGAENVPVKDENGNPVLVDGEAKTKPNGSLLAEILSKNFMTAVSEAVAAKSFSRKTVLNKPIVLAVSAKKGSFDYPINMNFNGAYAVGAKPLKDGDPEDIEKIKNYFADQQDEDGV